jgi:hypothetical protein
MSTLLRSFLNPGRSPRFLAGIVVLLSGLATPSLALAVPEWNASSLPFPPGISSTELLGVQCVAVTSCTADGKDGISGGVGGAFAETWNGTSWTFAEGVTRNPGPKNGALRGVFCYAAASCMTVGSYGTSGGVPGAMAQRQSGSTWTLYNIGIPSGSSQAELNDVSCVSSTLCIAVGYKMISGDDKALAMKFNGSAWTDSGAVPATNATLKAISCLSATNCLAVGSTGGSNLAETWNGSSWTTTATPPTPSGGSSPVLNGVHCVEASWCVATGTYQVGSSPRPFADIWNGLSWLPSEVLPIGPYPDASAFNVSCYPKTKECWAAGETHFEGRVEPYLSFRTTEGWVIEFFEHAPGAKGGAFRDISCIAVNSCRAVGWSLFSGTPTALVETLHP